MSITDELRRWAEDRAFVTGESGFARRIADFCDRIDAEHETKVSYWQGASYKDGYDEGFASADDWLAQHEDAMAEHGWVRMPVDADGVTIHVGERVQLIGNDPSTVSHMSLADDGWRVYVKYDGGIGTGSGEPKLIHHHKSTVEDVLDEIVDKANSIGCAYTKNDISGEEMMGALQEIVAEYAAKLRLVGDGE